MIAQALMEQRPVYVRTKFQIEKIEAEAIEEPKPKGIFSALGKLFK